MADDTQMLRRDIEETRRNLGSGVDALANKVSPRQVMHRQAHAARGRLSGLKDRVMGMTEQMKDQAGSTTHGAVSTAHDAGSKVGDTVTSAPGMAKERTRGAPLAAGLVAFAAGWVISAALPPTAKERQLAADAKDSAIEPVKQHAGELAQDLKENLQEPAQEAIDHVKASASSAAQEVKDESRSAATDVKGQAQESADAVRNT